MTLQATDSPADLELWLVVQPAQGEARELAIEAPGDTTAAELAEAVRDHLALRGTARPGLFCQRTQAWLPPGETLAVCGLRSGDALVLGTDGDTSDWGSAASRHLRLDLAELLVVGGPASGTHRGLGFGEHLVGRDANNDVALDDPSLSRTHLRVRIDEHSIEVADAGSRNGTSVEGVALAASEWRALSEGELVEAGRSLISFRRRGVGSASLKGSRIVELGGRIPFNRPPRNEPPFAPEAIALEAPPSEVGKTRLPLAASLLPVALGVGMWLLTNNVAMLLFSALTPLLAASTFVSERRGGKAGYTRDARDFRARLQRAEAQLRESHELERTLRREGAPGAIELVERAVGHLPDLWERRPADDDFLSLRIGTATQRAAATLAVEPRGSEKLRAEALEIAARYTTIPSIPLVVPLQELGALGLSGPSDRVEALGRWLVIQVAVLHSPREVIVAAAISPQALEGWSWLKWLPHTHSETSPLGHSHLASNPDDVAELLGAIGALVRERQAESRERFTSAATRPLPTVVLLLDERIAPERSLLADLLGAGPAVGVYGVWLGSRARDVPGECGAVVALEEDVAKLSVTFAGRGARLEDVTADGVPEEVAREIALALAPVRDTSASRGHAVIPRRVSLSDLLGIEPDPDDIARLWARERDDRSAIVGATGAGPLRIDLRADGPHGLIAGTTGAGKSELLQSLVASLAVEHSPSRLSFLFVDYKGGAAFKECVDLPHAVGLVTDLDEHLTRRALLSLNAELRRRETILRDAGAKDLLELELRDPDIAPPSLVIVIDEFATLAREVPDFVDGVVDVAQRGRSLGVHLLLATQRPGGVVNDNIRANTNLRIALRVNEPAESSDVVDSDQAARIPRGLPGRGFLRTGHGELTEFQTAYVGGVSDLTNARRNVVVRELSFEARSATQERTVPGPAVTAATDLSRMVAACREAAARLELPEARRPWVAPLPTELPLTQLPPGGPGRAVIGLLDEPALQRQRPYELDFDHSGSLLVYGASGSGKTALLETIAASLAGAASPDDLYLYGLDFASRALSTLERLPHCGSVVAGDDEERVLRLLSFLRKEVARRKDAFAAAGVFSLDEYSSRAGAHVLPRIVVFLDGYAAFVSAFERVDFGELVDLVPRLVADGRPLGLHFVITADRRAAVPGALSGIVSQKIVLRLASDDDYASLGLDVRALRDLELPPGRAFVESTLELQCAIAGSDARPSARADALARLGGNAPRVAPPVRTLPSIVGVESLPGLGHPLLAAFGIGDEELEPVAADLSDGHFLITGPYRSGRSTALAAIATQLHRNGTELVVLAPRRSPLTELDAWTRKAAGVEECESLARELAEDMSVRAESDVPRVIVVDDAEQLAEGPAAAPLDALVRRGRDVGIRVLAAGEVQAVTRAYSGWIRELRKDEQGLLLSPQPDVDGDIFGVRLPRRAVSSIPGRGYLARRGVVELVQVGSV